MREIPWTQFKKLDQEEIREGECLKVTFNGQMVFYVVVHPEEVMQDRVRGICQMIDASRGLPLLPKIEVIEETPEPAPEEEEPLGEPENISTPEPENISTPESEPKAEPEP